MKKPRKPKASDTPETDKQAVNVIGWYSCATVPADFARELERERNHMSKAAAEWMRSWREIHNRVTQAEVAAEQAQEERDAAMWEADRLRRRPLKSEISNL